MIFSKCGVPRATVPCQPSDASVCPPPRSLLRLRQGLTKLIETHTEKLGDAAARARAQSALYEELLQGLNVRRRLASRYLRCLLISHIPSSEGIQTCAVPSPRRHRACVLAREGRGRAHAPGRAAIGAAPSVACSRGHWRVYIDCIMP
jgi:hypothetical protein